MHSMCEKCAKLAGAILVLLGVAFLLVDLDVWSFWNIKWWTVGFLFVGLKIFCICCCPKCADVMPEKKK